MKQYNLLVTIHPWVDGNGRMSRLVMNYLQFEFGLIPTKVLKEDKAAYIKALNQSREEETIAPFQQFMLQEHSRNLRNEIEVFKKSMAEDIVINERKVVQKGGPEHKEVIQKITLDYDTIGGLFGDMYLGVHELTVVEKIASLGKSPEAEAPRQVSVIKNYRYKAMLMELSLFDISLSAKRRVFSSSSENCDGLPFTTLPLSLCASHERDFLK